MQPGQMIRQRQKNSRQYFKFHNVLGFLYRKFNTLLYDGNLCPPVKCDLDLKATPTWCIEQVFDL